MISNIDASVKRVKSAVINRMAETNQKRKDTGQYFGWLLKARCVMGFPLSPVMIYKLSTKISNIECNNVVNMAFFDTSMINWTRRVEIIMFFQQVMLSG